MAVQKNGNLQFSARSLLALTTIVAVISAAVGEFPFVASVGMFALVCLMAGIAQVVLAYAVGYGVLLPMALIASTPFVFTLAFFKQRPYLVAVKGIYIKIICSFVSFFENGGHAVT